MATLESFHLGEMEYHRDFKDYEDVYSGYGTGIEGVPVYLIEGIATVALPRYMVERLWIFSN